MPLTMAIAVFLGVAAIPFIYYGIALFSCWRFSAGRPAGMWPGLLHRSVT